MSVYCTCCSSDAHDVPIGLFNGETQLTAALDSEAASMGDECSCSTCTAPFCVSVVPDVS
jgi:hypothetical protein